MAKLTFVVAEGQEVVVPLVDALTLTLGRGDDNDVVVDDARVSTHHAALERNADGSIELRDLGSTSGTFVNGERVRTRCIHHGDTLGFGPLTAVFDLEEQQQDEAAISKRHASQGAHSSRTRSSRQEGLSRPKADNVRRQEAAALHQQWADAVKALSAQHAEKSSDVESLLLTEASTRHEIEVLTQHRDQVLAHLQEVREDCARDEARLADLRQQAAALEQRHKHVETLAAAHAHQVRLAEKKLADAARHFARLDAATTTLRDEFAAETTRLQDTKSQREEIARQCDELAETEAKLASVLHQFTLAEERHDGLMQGIAGAEARLTALATSITTLQGREDAAKGRLELLHAREHDLRSDLDSLATTEQENRARFEELRELIAQAEQQHQTRLDEHGTEVSACHAELHELESRLAPFREWKEAMDQLHARLGGLPPDSPEARDLWHEIEEGRQDLKSLVSTARTQAQEAAVAESPTMVQGAPSPPVTEHAAHTLENDLMRGEVHLNGNAPNDVNAAASPASLMQERMLKARLSHLRESVQREESRLEFLRQERGRHETRAHTGGPVLDAMQR